LPKLNFAKNRTLTSGLPQLSNPVKSWSVPLTLNKITQNIIEGDVVITETKIDFQGTVQPLTAEQLQFRPEGERSWKHLWIHCVAGSLNLNTQDKIIFNNERYKVLEVKDYSLYGYIEYMVIEDYQ